MSSSSSSFRPNNYTGTPTLLNETKNVHLYRVSEETKKKVSEDSRMIHQKMIDHNRASRKNVQKKERLRLKKNEEFREVVREKWRKRYENSPLGVDLVNQDDRRLERRRKHLNERRIEKAKYEAIASMIGTAKFDKASEKEVMESFDEAELRLALQWRKHINDDEIVKNERQVLDAMLAHEMVEISNKFDKVIKPGLREVAVIRERVHGAMASDTISRIYFGSSGSSSSSTYGGRSLNGRSGTETSLNGHSAAAHGKWESVKLTDGTRALITEEVPTHGQQPRPSSSSIGASSSSNNSNSSPSRRNLNSTGNPGCSGTSDMGSAQDIAAPIEEDQTSDGNSSTFRGPTMGLQKFEDDLDREFDMM